jgi:hypothetical protein
MDDMIAEAREYARYALHCARHAADQATKQWWLRMAAFWLGWLSDLQAAAQKPRGATQQSATSELYGSIH